MEQMLQLLAQAGLAGAGILPAQAALRHLRRGSPPPQFKSLLVAVFPYFAGVEPGTLSLYARGRDYHRVVRKRLQSLADRFGLEGEVAVDTSPFDEVALAAVAGLGNVGKNGLLVSREFGSFCFIGTMALRRELPPLRGALSPGCTSCGACVANCPTGALQGGRPEHLRCLSAITQRRQIDAQQAALLAHSPLIWGCDLCQLCCPANRSLPLTEEPAFLLNLIHSLPKGVLDNLSNRAFVKQYADRAFSWRGIAPLRRNSAILYANHACFGALDKY